jgi:predicted acyl esterase
MIVAGHADGYHNMAFRMYDALRAPKRILFGPWSHMSPRVSLPGPRIDHVPEMIRWWHRWLRGDDNGIDREPPIVMFVCRATRPRADLDAYEGAWRAEPAWPPDRLNETRMPLDASERPAWGPGDERG